MPWRRFLVANALGALCWAVVIALLGYCFGNNYEALEKWIGRGGLIGLGCLLVVGVLFYRHYLRTHLKPPPEKEKPGSVRS